MAANAGKPAPNACDQRLVLLHPQDNVLICTRTISAGTAVRIDGHLHTLEREIPLGHKVARCTLQAGDKVLRYGCAIGSMIRAAEPGEHIHSHNLQSDYIPAHNREAARGEATRS